MARRNSFYNYPEPRRGPSIPYKNERKSNPVLKGRFLAICAFFIEWVRFVRELAWWNAGFASLRKIRHEIEDYEPFFEPTIVPRALPPAQPSSPEEILAALQSKLASANPKSKYYSVVDYHNLYLSGELTPTQVAKALLPLITKDAKAKGCHANAWLQIKADLVLEAAEASTMRYKNKAPLGPLDGVPTGVKDEYDMDSYVTTLGSKNDYTGHLMEQDSNTSWCVRKLQEAGCLILGKLHMVEFGLDTPGNNPNFDKLGNPYNDDYYTGGSSSGSAYAVAAGLIPFALGSDGGGSIRIPSSFCSVFGLKPTHERLSSRPGQNHCITCACLGPIASDIRSLAAVFQAVAQPHSSSPFPVVPAIPRLLTARKDQTKILGIPEAWVDRAAPAVQQLYRSFIRKLIAEHGYRTVPIEIPFLTEGQIAHALVVLTDAVTLLPDTSSLTATTRILVALGRTTPSLDYLLALKLRRLLMQHLAQLWEDYPGMLIVTPTTSCAGWPIRSEDELTWGISDADSTLQTMEYVWLANFCGLPSLSMPAGYVIPEGELHAGEIAGPNTEGKVPVGFMATGEWGSEDQLLRFGLAGEQIGAAERTRPPSWIDVVAEAKASRT